MNDNPRDDETAVSREPKPIGERWESDERPVKVLTAPPPPLGPQIRLEDPTPAQ